MWSFRASDPAVVPDPGFDLLCLLKGSGNEGSQSLILVVVVSFWPRELNFSVLLECELLFCSVLWRNDMFLAVWVH